MAQQPVWQPQPTQVQQVLQIMHQLRTSHSNDVQQKLFQQVNQLKQQPEFVGTLCHIFARQVDQPVEVRRHAGALLKSAVGSVWESTPPPLKQNMKMNIANVLGDPEHGIRRSAADLISNIVTYDGFTNWPDLLPKLMQATQTPNPAVVLGAMKCLRNLCEDIPAKMDDERLGRPLNTLIPMLIQFFGHSNVEVRRHAVHSVNQFMLLMPVPAAMLTNMEPYLRGLFRLAQDSDRPVRKSVCQAFVGLLETKLEVLLPHLQDVIKFMLLATRDRGERDLVALEACEFWSAYCDTTAPRELLARFLPMLIPLLLQGMAYSDEELYDIGAEAAASNASVPDRDQDLKPRFHQARVAGYGRGGNDDFPEDGNTDWTLRKCSAASLDTLANVYGDKILTVLLPALNQCLRNPDNWRVMESGILALGAVAEGCFTGMHPHLPQLIPFIMRQLNHTQPLVRSIACWTLSRYSKWVVRATKDDAVYFRPMLEALLKRLLDTNKKVQEAACSGFATLEEEAQVRLLPYLKPVLSTLMYAFTKYQAKNMLILYDAIGTLAEAVGVGLNQLEYIRVLMPPLIDKWNHTANDNKEIFPLLECFTSIAQALKLGFANYAPSVFSRSLQIIEATLMEQQKANARKQRGMRYDPPDKEFIVCALDLLSGLTEGLGNSIEKLVNQGSTLPLLFECVKDADPDVRQSAFALLGDLAKACINHLRPHLDKFIPIAARNLNPRFLSVCNNASWAIGEIAVKVGPDLRPFVPTLMRYLGPLMLQQDLISSLLENTAITIGRLGLVCPDMVAPFLPDIALQWCTYLGRLREDDEKLCAFQGLCLVVRANPPAVVPSLPMLCWAIATWQRPNPQTQQMFASILGSFRAMLKQDWAKVWTRLDPPIAQRLAVLYKLG